MGEGRGLVVVPQKQLNVPLPAELVAAVKARAIEEGLTLGQLVERLLTGAMEGWEPAMSLEQRLEDHEQRLLRLEQRLGED